MRPVLSLLLCSSRQGVVGACQGLITPSVLRGCDLTADNDDLSIERPGAHSKPLDLAGTNSVDIPGEIVGDFYEEIERVAGAEAAYLLCRYCQGRKFYIPHSTPNDDHWLPHLLGREAADKMSSVFGGEDLTFPMKLAPTYSPQQVREVLNSGRTANECAAILGCTTRSVFRWRTRLRKQGWLDPAPPQQIHPAIPPRDAEELIRSGASVKVCMRQLGVGAAVIARWKGYLREQGWKGKERKRDLKRSTAHRSQRPPLSPD